MADKKLGRGLDFLINGENQLEGDEILDVDIERIHPNRFQPRKEFDETALRELADSISRHGFLQPLVLRPDGTRYEIVAGERRFRAAKICGLDMIPAVVKDLPDESMLEYALVENIQREDLDPIEKGRACRQLMEQLGLTQEEVAQRLGKDRSTVANLIRLLELPAEIQDLVHHGVLSMGHARALLRIAGIQTQLDLAQKAVRDNLSVRRMEELVAQQVTSEAPVPARRKTASEKPPHILHLEETLESSLGTKVRLQLLRGRKDHGKIVVEFFSEEDFERILSRLAPDRPDIP